MILTLSRQAEFSGLVWTPLFLSFKWPSVPCALNILAWDVFFTLSVLFAAPVFSVSRLATWIRVLPGLRVHHHHRRLRDAQVTMRQDAT